MQMIVPMLLFVTLTSAVVNQNEDSQAKKDDLYQNVNARNHNRDDLQSSSQQPRNNIIYVDKTKYPSLYCTLQFHAIKYTI